MQFLFIFLFIYLLILGLYSLGSVIHYSLKQTQLVSNIITGYALICILSNFFFFGLSIDTKLISLLFIIVICISLIFLIYKKDQLFLTNTKKILIITIFPIIFFLTIGLIYGEQYYVFRGNYWDYFNYVSSAVFFNQFNYSEVLLLKEKLELPLFFQTAISSQNSRPLVMLIMSYFFNFKFINVFLLSYLFKIFIISLIAIAFHSLLESFFKKNNFKEKLIITIAFVFSFWSIYVIEIDALSQLASLPVFFIMLTKINEIFQNFKLKNYYFCFYISILFSSFFLLYPELSVIYVGIVIIYGFISKNLNLKFFANNYLIIIFFSTIFLFFTIANYESTFSFLLKQTKIGLFINNDWWGYFGSFILGRENPIINPEFVQLLKYHIEDNNNIKSIISWLNDNLILFNYKFYQFNILPSALGFYFLTDIELFLNNPMINIIFLTIFSIYLIIIINKNIKVVLSKRNEFNILLKSSALFFLIIFSFLFFNFQIWSIIKLYFYFSVFYFLFIILSLEYKNTYLKFRINVIILILVLIFPLYKFSKYNDGILRYDSFPSVMSVDSKKKINWKFNIREYEKCRYIQLDFIENKINNFKKLYLSINLKHNNFIFTNKNLLENIDKNKNKFCIIKNI